ncbi:hypothetical protein NPIL_286261 [Nephila pilipes]|uniref:Uncharacterized protein n=1 Tax=Nephila pilipes TaxID=299642 RepID=A0A8X6QRA4_NEPPI|nr:hypothetical protein NPIL_286261 [Nephila pilipes]
MNMTIALKCAWSNFQLALKFSLEILKFTVLFREFGGIGIVLQTLYYVGFGNSGTSHPHNSSLILSFSDTFLGLIEFDLKLCLIGIHYCRFVVRRIISRRCGGFQGNLISLLGFFLGFPVTECNNFLST